MIKQIDKYWPKLLLQGTSWQARIQLKHRINNPVAKFIMQMYTYEEQIKSKPTDYSDNGASESSASMEK